MFEISAGDSILREEALGIVKRALAHRTAAMKARARRLLRKA